MVDVLELEDIRKTFEQINKRLNLEEATVLNEDFMRLATEIASASGGGWRKSAISEDEQKALDELKSMLLETAKLVKKENEVEGKVLHSYEIG